MNGNTSRGVGGLAALLVCLAGASPAGAQLITLGSVQTTEARIEVGGVELARTFTQTMNGVSHANAFDGTHLTPSQARAAGRAGAAEIAANASALHRGGFPLQNYTSVRGEAIYSLDVQTLVGGPHEIFVDYYLPPGFLEYSTNAELLDFVTFRASLFANLQVNRGFFGTLLFRLESDLTGGFNTRQVTPQAFSANPDEDLAALTHTNLTVAGDGFHRTVTWEYPAFTGTVSLGTFNAGEIFTVSYRMEAEAAAGDWFDSSALAGINDPFFLETDLLPQVPLFGFRVIGLAVPEPSALVLGGLGGVAAAVALARRARGRHPMSRATGGRAASGTGQ